MQWSKPSILQGVSPTGVENFFFGEAAKTERVLRFTTKSLYTE
jgi:hypothetical protein